MVARPPLRLRIEPMRLDDLPAVHAIERAQLRRAVAARRVPHELETNRLAQYLVARVGDEIVGLRRDVADGRRGATSPRSPSIPAWRRQHIGERLLLALLDLAVERGAHEATLEVRLSNLPARRLYEKFGFRPVGLRPRYYSDNNEDALIMTTEPLARRRRCATGSPGCAPRSTPRPRRVAARRRARPQRAGRGRERAARPRDRVVVRRDRHRARRGRPAHPRQRRRVARSPCTRRPAGSCPRSPPAPTCAGSCRSSTRRWADAGVDVGRHRRGRGHVRPGPGRLAAGRHQLRQGARLGPRPAAGRGQPPRGPRLRGVAARPRRGRTRPSRSFPLVALVVSGGHTFLAEMRDHLTYRLLGTTVDDAAGEAFDKVGRLLGPRLPGRAGDQARGRRRATAPRPRLPAGLAGRHVRLQLLGPQDRGPPDRRPRPAPTPVSADDAGRAAARRRRRRARLGLPGRRRRRPRDEDDPGRRGRSARARSCSAAASRRTRVLRARLAGEAEALGHPADRAAARPVHRQRGDDRRGRRAPVRRRRAGRPRPRRAAVAARWRRR